MQPESSDGFASVGTILPEERAALLPGGSFRFWPRNPLPFPNHSAPPRFLQAALPSRTATIQSDEQQADVAQLVEQLIRNQQVVSSSLTVGSIPHPPLSALPSAQPDPKRRG